MLSGYVNFPRKIMERIEKGESDFIEPGIFKELTELMKLNKPVVVTGRFSADTIITTHLTVAQSPDVIYAASVFNLGRLYFLTVTITSADKVAFSLVQ